VIDPRDCTPVTFGELSRTLNVGPEIVRRLLAAIVARGIHDPAVWSRDLQIPHRLIHAVGHLPRLDLEASLVSPRDGFQKLRLRTHDGLAVETVIIPLEKPGAVSICLSSQVGCAMDCQFCATARMSRRRNLKTWEIIDQFIHARDLARKSGRRATGVVFMGMGEPFLNYGPVMAAASILCCPWGGSIGAKAISISTVGLVREIERFTDEGHKYRLIISLGAPTDAKRARLVPVAARTAVADVVASARRHARARGERVTLAYVCISGENVGEDDARALGELIGDTPVRVDLIEVTDATGRFLAPSPQELRAFRDALSRYVGQPIVRRYSGGKDIQAACGTLAGEIFEYGTDSRQNGPLAP
jgi:23S rRNA (adenine2503-C2)-methyltransferase